MGCKVATDDLFSDLIERRDLHDASYLNHQEHNGT